VEDDEALASGDPPAAPVDAPGTRIGKYELLRPLGAGGMGIVWAARDADLDREVAIKLLRSASAGPELRTRLLREARAMARLKHPNVLTVYEVGTQGTRDFIAMELVDGTNLDTWLQTKPPAREVWDALLAAGRGLAAAHAAGVVHRDFKPHNVLRSRDGRVLVTDFGLARGLAEEPGMASTLGPGASAGDSVLDVKLTTTGQLLGTPAYMAPEQFAGEPPDPRTDQFAFCITVWEALSGEHPFRGTSVDELRRLTAEGRIVDAALPAGVRPVLARGLAARREARWPDMRTLLAALERARHARRRRASPASRRSRRRGRPRSAPRSCASTRRSQTSQASSTDFASAGSPATGVRARRESPPRSIATSASATRSPCSSS
jgi:serine/threonine protein kinase